MQENGEGQKDNRSETVHKGRYQALESSFKGANADIKNHQTDEAHRRLTSAEGS